MKIFNLPDLGEGLAEAEVREWYVKEGDSVKLDQPLLSVETAKAVVEIPSPYAGQIVKLHALPQTLLKTGEPLVSFNEELDAAARQGDRGSIVGKLDESQLALEEEKILSPQSAHSKASIKAMPAVRQLAQQLNVDLNAVRATGAQGQITVDDVKREAGFAGTSLEGGEALHGVRRVMAQVMSRAHQEVAAVTLMDDVDLGQLAPEADFSVLLVQALIAAVKKEPGLNAWFDGKTLQRRLFPTINLGLAMDTAEGLLVPVLKDVAQYSAQDLREQIQRLKKEVGSRHIEAGELQGATLSLSNFGNMGGKYANPIIVPPMVAILGAGRVYEAAVVRAGKVVVSSVLPLSLSIDHRAVTGGEAARFLAAAKTFLEQEKRG